MVHPHRQRLVLAGRKTLTGTETQGIFIGRRRRQRLLLNSSTDWIGSGPAAERRELDARQQSVRLMFDAVELPVTKVQPVQPGVSARGITPTAICLDQRCLSVNRRDRSSVSNTAGLSVVLRRSPVARR